MHVTTVGLDLAKNVLQVHGVTSDGTFAFNRSLRRAQVLRSSRACRRAWSGSKRVA